MAGLITRIVLLVIMFIDFLAILFCPLFVKIKEGENNADKDHKVRKVRNYLYIVFGVLFIIFVFVVAFAK